MYKLFLMIFISVFVFSSCDDDSSSNNTQNCGNGILDEGETCDGTNLDSQSCISLGFSSGTLSCSASCTLDTSACKTIVGNCGNNVLDAGEECDGTELNSQTCESQGFSGGSLSCNTDCTFDTSACDTGSENCGNNVLDAGEECDGTELNSQTCESQGFSGGSLSCNPNCTFNTSACTEDLCGNNVLDAGEECDGNNLNSQTCESQGFSGGSLSCNADCTFNTSACGDSEEEIVCGKWNSDRADMQEGTWTGDIQSCNAGDYTGSGRANTLKLVNLYRFLAGLDPVTNSSALDQKSQDCALMMDANNQLSHNPPSSWTCYSQDGADAAGSSNIATTPAVASIDLYMTDPGNNTTLGHRRWILSNWLSDIGIGSTDSYSCLWVINGMGGSGNTYTAFPTPGVFPYQAISPSWSSVDETGWSIQSDSINLSSAQVTITDNGTNKPVSITQLGANYGSSYAISIIPQGWTTQAGHTYHVEVTGVSSPFSYDVHIVDCSTY